MSSAVLGGTAVSGMSLLRVRDLSLSFGGLRVLDRVNLEVAQGSVCGLVGPNGAGKTSLFNCISGLYRPDSGAIELDGEDLLRRPPHALAALGLARTFQHPSLDADTTVRDSVLVGAHSRLRGGPLATTLRLPYARRAEAAVAERATELLSTLDLASVADHPASALPHATQKRVELARALLAEPRLLLLDEPAAGVPHGEVDGLAALIRRLCDEQGLTVLLVEHHMGLVATVTDRVFVLVEGENVVDGPAAEVQVHPAVVDAYLGEPL